MLVPFGSIRAANEVVKRNVESIGKRDENGSGWLVLPVLIELVHGFGYASGNGSLLLCDFSQVAAALKRFVKFHKAIPPKMFSEGIDT